MVGVKIDGETEKKIQEMQILEQNLQNLLLQKQAFQLELNETENAGVELKKAKGDVYKVVGQIMLSANRVELEKELKNKKNILGLRIKAIEKQEIELKARLERFREEVLEKIK